MKLIQKLDVQENKVIARYSHDCLPALVQTLSKEAFEHFLLQRRLVSFQFTPLYDEATCFLSDPAARRVITQLRQEEYPRNKPSHREDLHTDLTKIGITPVRIGEERTTPQTAQSIHALYELIRPHQKETPKEFDIRCITGLRMAEEILVAQEYEVVLKELEKRYKFSPQQSVFYHPHWEHDRKKVPLGTYGKSHSDKIGSIIARLVTTPHHARVATRAMEAAYTARITSFYSQFVC